VLACTMVVAMSGRRRRVAVRCASRVSTVRVEAVDTELDLGEDTSCGELAVSHGCHYHLRNMVKDPASGALEGRTRRPETGECRGGPVVGL
jgi:hypothetical protein